MFFTSKQRRIEEQLEDYSQQVRLSITLMKNAFEMYCRDQDRNQLQRNYVDVHAVESRADDIRREIETTMYSKSLFPESRGDILGLLESLDKVPNQAESVTRSLITHCITIPETFQPEVFELIDIGQRCVDALLEGAAQLFSNFTGATVAVGKVDQLESEADRTEADLIERIFSSSREEIPDLQKILLRDLAKHLSAICDRCEKTSDRIRITVAKRKV